MTAPGKLGIYIHVPFCASKCPYCDFYSLSGLEKAEAYTAAVENEIGTLSRTAAFTDESLREKSVDTVYFGGGTPSYLGEKHMNRILNALRNAFHVESGAEITAECNPSSPGFDGFIAAVAENGVNRISLGMQSASDPERKALGRKADRRAVENAADVCRKAGIKNLSLDVMLGIPGQTSESLRETLAFALSLAPEHLSAYMLKLEENTFFYRCRDRLALPEDDEVADWYEQMSDMLTKAGMRHYEISNFCFSDAFSRHNLKYWQGDDYLGIGPAAHSFVNGKRFYFPRSLEDFIAGSPAVYDGEGGGAEEYVMLSLRLDTGIRLSELRERFGVSPSEKFFKTAFAAAENGLARFDGDRFALTPKGFLISNALILAATEELI